MIFTPEAYPWESALSGLVGENETAKFQALRNLVENRCQAARRWKCVLVAGFMFLLIALMLILWICDILSAERRSDLINGVIAFVLAVFGFSSSYLPRLKSREVEKVLGTKIPTPIMRLIQEHVNSISEDTPRWFTLIGAIGIFTVLILKLLLVTN